jgi:hypothetical protein
LVYNTENPAAISSKGIKFTKEAQSRYGPILAKIIDAVNESAKDGNSSIGLLEYLSFCLQGLLHKQKDLKKDREKKEENN